MYKYIQEVLIATATLPSSSSLLCMLQFIRGLQYIFRDETITFLKGIYNSHGAGNEEDQPEDSMKCSHNIV